MKRRSVDKSVFDHLLATIGGLMATYSIGQSLAKPDLATFLAIAVLVTSILGFVISQLIRSQKILNLDGYLWAMFGVFSVVFLFRLNKLLPEEGFPWEIAAGGALSWMLIFGSLVSWRDQTLLFLSLPSLALFGLVGTFDVYKPGTVFFFIFLVCIAVLYARVHQRSMVERARRTGVEEPRLLWRDAWKWVAGPEWALASAGVIILVSLVGAPILQGSLQGVSGAVRVNLAQAVRNRTQPRPSASQVTEARIGQGPVNLSDRPVFRVAIDRPRYFRRNFFSSYSRGWSQIQLAVNNPLGRITSPVPIDTKFGEHSGVSLFEGKPAAAEPILSEPKRAEIVADQTLDNTVMAPGPITEMFEKPNLFSYNEFGQVTLNAAPPGGSHVLYYFRPTSKPKPEDKAELPAIYGEMMSRIYENPGEVPQRVRDLAREVTQSATNDAERAEMIQAEIERRCMYNTNVPATPSGSDPVDHFLFDAKEGYCDVFASAMVLMAREVGMPARYVVGYIVNDPNKVEGDMFQVYEKDSHAWCEIYFEGRGWVVYDPTEGATAVEGGERGSTNELGLPWYQRNWFGTFLNVVLALAVLSPIGLYLYQRLRTFRFTGKSPSEILNFQDGFQRSIEKELGHPRRFSQTLREFVLSAAPQLKDLTPQAMALVHQFEDALFSARPMAPEGAKELASSTRAFQKALREQAKARKSTA